MKAYTKDVIKTISKGMKRFLALALISALGVCMMSGLTASCDDLRYSADTFFDEQNLFDIMVVSTMGLTDEDVDALSRIDGIEAVEGTFSETVHTKVNGQTKQASVNVLSQKDINVPYILDGEMPLRADEILVTQKYINESGLSIGDQITIEEKLDEYSDKEEEESEEEDTEEGSIFDLELEKEYDESNRETVDADDYKVEVEEEEEEPNFLLTTYTIVGVVIDAADVNSSEGAVVGTGSDICDHNPVTDTDRRMRAGRISVAVRVGTVKGDLKVYAEADGLRAAVLHIDLV